MSPTTSSFKQYHVYSLRQTLAPNSPFTHALVLTSGDFLHRHYVEVLSVLLLSPEPRDRVSELRVTVQCKGTGGTAQLRRDMYASVDNIFPIKDNMLHLHSGTEIAEHEKADLQGKMRRWLGI